MLISFLFGSVFVYSVFSEDCVKYTFDDNFDFFSNDLDGCGNHQGVLSDWTRQTYTNTSVSSPNENTNWFMSPSTSLSCISSFSFSMESGGVIEVLAYMDPTEREDHVAVFVHQIADIGLHPVVGTGHIGGHSNPGWLKINIILNTVTEFNGYITFLGVAYPGTVLIVDSFRYVGPSLNPDSACILYDEDNSITTIPITAPTIPEITTPTLIKTTIPITTEGTTVNDDCMRYTFDEKFELFSNDLDGCGNYQGVLSQWTRQIYTNTSLSAPNENTNWFMSPSTSLSCISSFPFTMKAFGVLEVKVYLDSRAAEDHIAVLVHQIVDSGSHPVVGMGHLFGDAELGWVDTRIHLVGATQFNGYVTFLGIASPDSTLIVDSFRYVGPSLDPDETCILYQNDNAITSIPITTQTMESIITETTTPSMTEIATPTVEWTTTETPSITEITTPIIEWTTTETTPSVTETTITTDIPISTTTETTTVNDDCVKYTFGEDFEKLFTTCSDIFGSDKSSWSRHKYSDTTIIPPNEQSEWFISPSSTFGCIASFNFTMSSNGLVEVKTYINSKNQIMRFSIFAVEIAEVSNYTAYNMINIASIHSADTGWHDVKNKITTKTTTPFMGFLIFDGYVPSDVDIVVDSFRYVPPSMDADNACILYPDDDLVPTSSTNVPSTTDGSIPITTDRSILTTTDGSILTTTDGPILSTTDGSILTTTDGSILSTTDGPILSTTDGPILSTTDGSILTTTDGSILTTTDGPILSTTDGSILTTTDGSILSTTDGSILTTTDGSILTTTDGSIPITTDGSILTTTDGSILTTTDGSILSTTDGSILSTTDGSILSTTDGSILSTTDGPILSTTDGSILTTTDGSILTTTDGSIPITTDGSILTTTDGSILTTTDGSILSTTDGSILSTTDGSILSTTDGSILSTTDGSMLSTTDGSILSTTDGSILSTTDGSILTTTDGSILTTTDGSIPITTDGSIPITTDESILTTTDGPIITTTDATDTDPDNPLEKIIIIKKTKTIRRESTVIKKIFRLN